MTARLVAVILGLTVALAAWGYVDAKGTGLPDPPAAPAVSEPAATVTVVVKDAPAKPAEPPAADPAAIRRAAEEKEKARLIKEYGRTHRTMTSRMASRKPIEFERVSVKNVLAYLAEVGKFSIVYDKALEEAGIDLDARTVSIRVSGITYEKALELILPRECGYRVGPGYVLITTLEQSWLPLRTATYNIRLALAQVPDFTDAPRFEPAEVLKSSQNLGGSGELFGTPTIEPEDPGKPTPERIIESSSTTRATAASPRGPMKAGPPPSSTSAANSSSRRPTRATRPSGGCWR
jgi:hypothetical protein